MEEAASLLISRCGRMRVRLVLWHAAGLGLLLLYFYWPGSLSGSEIYRTTHLNLIVTTALAYVLATVIFFFKIKSQLKIMSDGFVLYTISTSLVFGLTILIVRLAGIKGPYIFLLAAYIWSVIWGWLGIYFLFRKEACAFGIDPESLDDDLRSAARVQIRPVSGCPTPDDLHALFVNLGAISRPAIRTALAECGEMGIPIYHVRVAYEVFLGKVPLRYLSPRVASLMTPPSGYTLLKRVLDVLLVLLSTPMTLPLVLIVSILVKLDSPGPVFFRQERVGKGGKLFTIVKFRTMRIDAEKHGARFAASEDPRVTRVGRWLRKFRIDEIPQFWNVLKGDMSLIGPRPEQAVFVEKFRQEIPFYDHRHLVRPGITGWAQVMQGYAAGEEETKEKLEYDLYYVKNLSFWLDYVILLRTIRTILTGFGAR